VPNVVLDSRGAAGQSLLLQLGFMLLLLLGLLLPLLLLKLLLLHLLLLLVLLLHLLLLELLLLELLLHLLLPGCCFCGLLLLILDSKLGVVRSGCVGRRAREGGEFDVGPGCRC
jgi:hypothetical protein